MKKDLQKYCKYYKGEKETPYEVGAKKRFWRFEYNYFDGEYLDRKDYWETEGVKMANEFEEAKTVMDKYNDITVKGFIAYMAVMQMYNAPFDGCLKFILEYGKDN